MFRGIDQILRTTTVNNRIYIYIYTHIYPGQYLVVFEFKEFRKKRIFTFPITTNVGNYIWEILYIHKII